MNGKHPVEQMGRKQGIAGTTPARHTSLRAAAESLSRRNIDAAVVEILMEAVQRATQLAYERDDSGLLCNVDSVTFKLLVPAPWGRNGYKRWGLRLVEGVCLREVMQQRQRPSADRPPGLFLYDRTERSWRVNMFDYDFLSDAQRYWEKHPISVQEYRAAHRQRFG